MGFIMANRSKIYTKEFMGKFNDVHQKATGKEIKAGGYPDTGNGWYSRELPYEQWLEFNNRQRAHANFVEWIASNIALILIGGLYFPIVCACLGLGVAVSRILYAVGYAMGGANHPIRTIGAVANDLVTLATIVFAVWSCIKWMNQTPFA